MNKNVLKQLLLVVFFITTSAYANNNLGPLLCDIKTPFSNATDSIGAVEEQLTDDVKIIVLNKGGYVANYYITWMDQNGKLVSKKYTKVPVLQERAVTISQGSSYIYLEVTLQAASGEKFLFDTHITNNMIQKIGSDGFIKYTLWGTYIHPRWNVIFNYKN